MARTGPYFEQLAHIMLHAVGVAQFALDLSNMTAHERFLEWVMNRTIENTCIFRMFKGRLQELFATGVMLAGLLFEPVSFHKSDDRHPPMSLGHVAERCLIVNHA